MTSNAWGSFLDVVFTRKQEAYLNTQETKVELKTRDSRVGVQQLAGVTTFHSTTLLSGFATPSNLNASNFLTLKDNIMFNPIWECSARERSKTYPTC